MAQSRKLIKMRIKSVRNTRKITKAMELVAASKMRRAVASVLRARPYASALSSTIKAILDAAPESTKQVLLQAKPEAKKTLIVLMTSDRGLAGGLNVNMTRKALAHIKEIGLDTVDIIAVGKRGGDALERLGVKVIARFPALTNNPAYTDLLPVARMALDAFIKGEYKRVIIAHTEFVSGITQKPTMHELLPFKKTEIEEGSRFPLDGARGPEPVEGEVRGDKAAKLVDVTFEPSPQEVFDRVLPSLARTVFWQALLESAASEHAARMLAMRNASEAAGDMLTALTFTYNQARQSSITQEIAEISSGKAALE